MLVKIAEGDQSAFAILFKDYHSLLGGFIMRITESAPLTEEIVQDVFLKIWLNRAALTEIECFKAYLMVVARNHTFNCLKQIAREKLRQKEWVNTMLHDVVNSTEDNAGTHTCNIIDQAVALLPSQQKKVFTLSRTHGVRQKQIARELNISHETVKKHLVLAMRFLRNHLRAHLGFLVIFFLGISK